jgi:hypothetical protein
MSEFDEIDHHARTRQRKSSSGGSLDQTHQSKNSRGLDVEKRILQGENVVYIPATYHSSFIPFLTPESSIWDIYNNEAKIIDTELVKDWTSSLNFLLVFVSIM